MKKSTAAILAVLLAAACIADVYQTRQAEIKAMQNQGVAKMKESVDTEAYREAERNEIEKIFESTEAAIRESKDQEEIDALKHAKADAVKSPLDGQLMWSFGGEGVPAACIEPFIGQKYKEGDIFCYLQTKWGEIVEIPAALGGKLVDISVKPGQKIRQGDTIAWIEREA